VSRVLQIKRFEPKRVAVCPQLCQPLKALRVSLTSCIRRSPNCPMPTKTAIRTANATPNLSPMRFLFTSNSYGSALPVWVKVWKEEFSKTFFPQL